jgi:hypothetical protein
MQKNDTQKDKIVHNIVKGIDTIGTTSPFGAFQVTADFVLAIRR